MGLFNRTERWSNFGGNININGNLKESDLKSLFNEPGIHSLQFYQFKNPSERTWKVLNKFYSEHPEIGLRILWYDPMEFSFLKHIPALKKFTIASFLTKDFTPINDYLDLVDFGIEETKSTAVNVDFISNFRGLKRFYCDGMKKGLSSISDLKELEILTLRGVKLPDLKIVEQLEHLKELNLLFGSYQNLDSIGKLENLERLEISRTRQIPDFDFLKSLSNLKFLCFEGMSQMAKLPSLNGLDNLKKLQIENNSSLADISSVSELKKLETFLLFFPENFKAALRKQLTAQAFEIMEKSNTIKSNNLWRLASDEQKVIFESKGIEKWGYNPEIEKVFEKNAP